MNRRRLLQASVALPVVAALAPLVGRSTTFLVSTAPAEKVIWTPCYLRARMTWGTANFRQQSVASLTGFGSERGQELTFWMEGDKPTVDIEASDDGLSWTPAPDAVAYRIEPT